MKDEYSGNIIKEYLGLGSKMYSILDTKNNEKNPNKGHNSYIKHGEFFDTLYNKKVLRYKMRGIKSKIIASSLMKGIKHLHLVWMINDIFLMTVLIHYHMEIKTDLNKKICFSFY